ncbi:hypothetical protein [Methylobacterium frigidaeris]|uniref:Uncharacterized protein n=1 Tax=Methylobacterium frigidaeris TaxID=2038277 RepID=A0AA37HBE5_9HYPH|nr:hypothetical protein [Methylobacterium frigidaeris]PIK70209.1 hypothetical protein CS379_25855 [Methylobacterium frigidaeris]GJD62687.1 hypothetical protein MPEAHAMD_2844 [Methylobacterium frigidaeris]
MTSSAQWQRTLDAVLELAEDIARISPDCADRAMQIVRLIRACDPPVRRVGDLDGDDGLEEMEFGIGPLHRSKTSDA